MKLDQQTEFDSGSHLFHFLFVGEAVNSILFICNVKLNEPLLELLENGVCFQSIATEVGLFESETVSILYFGS